MHIVSPCLLCGPISCELCSCAHTWINVCLPGQELCEQRDKKKNRRKEVNYFVIYYSLRLSVYFSSYPLSLSLWANCYDDFFYNFTICAQGSLTQTFFSVQCFVSLFLSPPIHFLSLFVEWILFFWCLTCIIWNFLHNLFEYFDIQYRSLRYSLFGIYIDVHRLSCHVPNEIYNEGLMKRWNEKQQLLKDKQPCCMLNGWPSSRVK